MESAAGSEIQQAIESLESLIAGGAKVPLIDQVRVRAADLRERVDGVHQAVRWERAGLDDGVAEAMDELDRVIAEARPIPLTDDVRLHRRRLYAALDGLRERVP